MTLIRLVLCINLLLLVALPSVLDLASAEDATSQSKPKSELNPASLTPQKPEVAKEGAAAKDPSGAVRPAQQATPAIFELKTSNSVIHRNDPMIVQGHLLALRAIDVCINHDAPHENVELTVYRAAFGPLTQEKMASTATQGLKPHSLLPGQTVRFDLNLKTIPGFDMTQWQPGEYRIQGLMDLGCGDKTQIPSKGPLHLLLLDP